MAFYTRIRRCLAAEQAAERQCFAAPMRPRPQVRWPSRVAPWLWAAVICVPLIPAAMAAQPDAVPLDRVVAVVNRQVILSSDVDDAVQLAVLDPAPGAEGPITRPHALEELISRALIEQQIRQEDLQSIEPSAAEVTARVEEIRRQLPACVLAHCSTDEGWKAFLNAHHLTEQRVQNYLHNRMEILRFIEQRFRQGIEITHDEIENYYRNTLLPQYPAGVAAPPLGEVQSRIEEILLEQQVSALFDNWLDNLRTQGDVEVLDPALEVAQTPAGDDSK